VTAHYERLSFLDNSFLALETRTTHFHVGSVMIFEAGTLRTPEGGIDVARIKAHFDSKLHLVPRYRQRLAWVPVEQYPVWVDDEHFNIDYHVRHIALPRPGTDEQLKRIAGRLMSQQLDRDKPLWEIIILEGLEGDRFAMISKIHHAMIDGVSGVDLMAVLLNMVPTEELESGPAYEPRTAPNGTELVVRETTRRITETTAKILGVRGIVGDAARIGAETVHRVRAMAASLSSGWLVPTGRSPLNGPVGPNRRFDWLDVPLDEIKAIKNAFGGTVNDAILAIVAGGVRHFFLEYRSMTPDELEDLDFRVMAPVSVRAEGQAGTMGNQVAMWLVSMPVGEPDPGRRFEIVAEETTRLKETDQALGAASLVRLSAGAPATLVALGARLATNARPFNMTVTNVPGPQFPLYMLTSRLDVTYPLVPLWESHGVGIALFSYLGAVSWGLNADYDVVEDVSDLAASLQFATAELLAAAVAHVAEFEANKKNEKTASRRSKSPTEKASGNGGSKTRKRAKKRPPMGTR
jgi:WS/DGAT/MGAT family acyltransferase